MIHELTIEQMRMHHQHSAALTKVGNAMELLSKEMRNLPFALSQMGLDEPKMYVVYKEFCDPDNGNFSATNVGIYRKREDAEIQVRNEFVEFEANCGFGQDTAMKITNEDPWLISVVERDGNKSASFGLVELEVR